MEELFGPSAVLFESGEGEESLRIECAVSSDGGLLIMQESDGPLTMWCFEETPHRVETEVDSRHAAMLSDYFHLDEVGQLPAVLRMEYTGFDSGQRIRELMRRLEIPYRVLEHAIER